MPIINILADDSEIQAMRNTAMELLSPGSVNKRMAAHGAVTTRNHLRNLALSRDRGSRFYESYAAVTTPEWTDFEGLVVIPPVWNKAAANQRGNPLAAHFFGKTFTQANLTPPGKYYTIPARDEYRHRSAREFPDLKPLIRMVGGKPEAFALAQREQSQLVFRTNKKTGITKSVEKRMNAKGFSTMGGLIAYWLVKTFKLKGGDGVGDKTVLPSEADYRVSIHDALEKLLERFRQ